MSKKESKTLIIMYVFLLILSLISVLVRALPYEFIVYYFPFGVLNKTVFDIISLFLYVLIFWKAHKLYLQTQNKGLSIIAGGFLAGSLLQVEELLYLSTLVFNISHAPNPQIFYFMFGQLIFGISLCSSIFIKFKKTDKNHFLLKMYTGFVLFALFIFLMDKMMSVYLIDLIYKILPNVTLTRVVEQALYLLTAFVCTDIKIVNKQRVFSLFTIGLFVLGIGPLLMFSGHSTTLYSFMYTLIKIVGFILIYMGLDDLKQWDLNVNFRQRLSTYMSLLLICSYVIFIPVTSVLFDIKFPPYSSSVFLAYFIVAMILQYVMASKFSSPIVNIIEGMNQYSPKIKPEKLRVISNDEIGLLTNKLNDLLDLIWKYTQELLSKQKIISQASKKEHLLSSVIQASRNSLYVDEILDVVCKGLVKLIDVERISIVKMSENNNIFTVELITEYKVNKSIASLKDAKRGEEVQQIWLEQLFKLSDYLAVDDIANSDMPNAFKEFYKELGIKSIMGVSIKNQDQKWGGIVLSKYHRVKHWTKSDLSLLQTIANQLFIALQQAQLYKMQKDAVQKERTIRDISSKVRSSLDLASIKHEVVTQVAEFFQADKVVFSEYDPKTEKYSTTKEAEYRSSDKLKSHVGVDLSAIPGFNEYIRDTHVKGQKDVIFSDLDTYLEENNLKGTLVEDFYREYSFEASAAINIYYQDLFLGNMIIGFSEPRVITDDEINFIKDVANQAGVAIYQATLYESVQSTAKREKLLREIADITRRANTYEEMERGVVDTIGKFFKADRCYTRYFDKINGEFLKPGVEYRSSEKVISLRDFPVNTEGINYFVERIKKGEKTFWIENTEKYIEENHLEGSAVESYLKDVGTKSDYPFPMWDRKNEIGWVVLHYTQEPVTLSDDDIDLMYALVNQISIAIDQIKLYEEANQNAFKERLLREIVSEIKLSQNLDQAYTYILSKLSNIFGANRVLFFETLSGKYESANIKYEYMKDEKMKSLRCVDFYDYIDGILQKVITSDVVSVNDMENDYSIGSCLAVPLVSYTHEESMLGVITVFKEGKEPWTDFECDLLASISDAVVLVIWELSSLIEITKLKDTFVATLAHDLQVPLVGEQKALEFLMAQEPSSDIGDYKDFISEILLNNNEVLIQLKKLLESYYYEQGSKLLELKEVNFNKLLVSVLDGFTPELESKNLTLKKSLGKSLSTLIVDEEEIKKVISILIDNAIVYSKEGGMIHIKTYEEENIIVLSVKDYGIGMTEEEKKRIFNRYEMVTAIKRKIGSGLNLYLSKMILNAHNASISFVSEKGKGSTFYVKIPFK